MARKKIDCTKWYLLDSNENCKLIGCQREMEPVSRLAENSSFPQRGKINHWPFISSVAINFLHQLFRYYPSLYPSIWSKIRSRVVRRNSVSRDDEWRKPNELFIFIINLVALFIIDIPRLRTTDIRSAAICIFNSHRFDFIVDRSCWKICYWGNFREENHFIGRNEYFFRKKIKKLINY